MLIVGFDPTDLVVQAQTSPQVRQADLIYEGAFRLPSAQSAEQSFAYGAMGMAHNPARNSLYLTGHVWYQLTAEVSVPAVVNSNKLSDLATATLLQPWTDVTEGRLAGGKLYGQFVYGGQLFGAVYSTSNAASHFKSGLNLSVSGDVQGLFRVGTLDQRFVAGYMASIPTEWQAVLGGPALTGGCCNPGQNGAISLGPAVSVFDPANVGGAQPVPATPLLYYTPTHPTLGAWNNTTVINPAYNMMTEVVGAVFPSGTRSLLFFGRTGVGVPCYGNGTDDPAMHGQPWPQGGAGAVYCYDPNEVNGGFGPHAYPYEYHAWAYDAGELQAVKSGQKNPWDVRPYAMWTFQLPFEDSHRHIQGVAFDTATRRIFLSQLGGEPGGIPVIHVFKVGDAGTAPPPAPPANVRIVR
jgi:hypothetical protein